jgi:hypothetical protein
VYRHDPKLQQSHEAAHAEWVNRHRDMVHLSSMRESQNVMSDSQRANYVAWRGVVTKVQELKRGEDPHSTRKNSLRYLLLTLLTDVKPKRADFGNLRVYIDTDPDKKNENYIVMKRASLSAYLVMHVYKTSKKYHRFEEDLAPSTVRVLKDSLRRYERNHVFVDVHGKPFGNNGYTNFVKRTFEHYFGTKTGVSLIRHIFLSEAVALGEMSEDERRELSRDMLHNVEQQSKYRFVQSKNQKCECVCKDKDP